MKAPSSSLDFERWAREQVPARNLTRGQAQVLTLLASYANRRGECFPSIDALAQRAVLSTRHTERLLGELGRLGLVESFRRGRGCPARRRLCPEASMPAPPCPRGTMPLFDALLEPAFDAPAASSSPAPKASMPPPPPGFADPPSWTSEPPPDGGQKEQEEEEKQQREAHAPVHTSPALSPSLPAVLEILARAPDLVIEDMTVDTALRAFPHADHTQAAYRVVTLALEQGLEHLSASRQLWRALERQTQAPAAGRGTAPHSGRRRVAPPPPISADGRRWGPVPGNKYDQAAGLTP